MLVLDQRMRAGKRFQRDRSKIFDGEEHSVSTRPLFTGMVTIAAFAVVSLGAYFAAFERASRWKAPATPIVSDQPLERTIEQKYGVRLVLGDHKYPIATSHGLIQATDVNRVDLDRYRKILDEEFLVYPEEFVRRSRLKRIVLCRGLSFNGQNRSAVPDLEHDTLYLDVVAGEHKPEYQRRAIHHDFFHIVDFQDDGQLYTDEQWAKLNSPTFRYGSGGVRMQDDARSGLPWDQPGFLNKYSTSGVEEDKAEIFTYMITCYSIVEERAMTDKLIRKKMAAMKALLAKFSPDMNDDFWSEHCLQ